MELKLKQVIKMIDNRIKSTLGRELNVASMLIREALDRELKKISFPVVDVIIREAGRRRWLDEPVVREEIG